MGQQVKVLAAKLLALLVEGTSYRLWAHLSLNLVSSPAQQKCPHLVCTLLAEKGTQEPDLLLLWLASRQTQGQMPEWRHNLGISCHPDPAAEWSPAP